MELPNKTPERAGNYQAVINLVGRMGVSIIEPPEPVKGTIEYWRIHHERDEIFDPTLI